MKIFGGMTRKMFVLLWYLGKSPGLFLTVTYSLSNIYYYLNIPQNKSIELDFEPVHMKYRRCESWYDSYIPSNYKETDLVYRNDTAMYFLGHL